jgi:phage shock protein A
MTVSVVCRLLRNRVSAQQARERKKQFVTNLESKNKQMGEQVMQLQEQVKKLERENTMLRQVIKNMKAGNAETGYKEHDNR